MIQYKSEKYFLERGSEYAAGFDLKSTIDIELADITKINTGIYLEIPNNMYGKIESRSSLASKGITVEGGIIDADYRGEIMVILYKKNNIDYSIKTGDKIAQIIFHKYYSNVEMVNTLSDTIRGDGGFGSTGI